MADINMETLKNTDKAEWHNIKISHNFKHMKLIKKIYKKRGAHK
jgi:hypothetical protein